MTDSYSKLLRNGMKVRYLGMPMDPESSIGHVHGVGRSGFSVRYEDDGESFIYPWKEEADFSVLSGAKGDTHDSIAQDLLLMPLDRDLVEDLLRRYRNVLAEDLEEIALDPATPEKYRPGMRDSALRLRHAEDL